MPNAPMAELVVDARNGVGESPVWLATEQALYWTDIPARRMHRLSVASGALEQWDLPEMAGCMAPHARGGWIAAMETGIFHLHLHGGGLATASRLATEAHSQPGMRFNDGRTDRQGRFWVSSMARHAVAASATGTLFRYAKGRFATRKVACPFASSATARASRTAFKSRGMPVRYSSIAIRMATLRGESVISG